MYPYIFLYIKVVIKEKFSFLEESKFYNYFCLDAFD